MGFLGDVVLSALQVSGAALEAGNPRLLRFFAARHPVKPGWIAKLPRLVIVGPGGCGKSTLLKQLLARAAGEGRVPVWLPLATLPAEGALTPALLLNHLAEQASMQLGLEESNTAFFEALLRDRRLTLGLDALDECGSLARRQRVCNLIEEISRRWSGCQILLTSRPEALRETLLQTIDDEGKPEGGFVALELQPFTRADVAPFLSAAFDDGAALADQLLRRSDVDSLLQAPLTLVLVGLVARSGAGLPAGRTPLFARCVETVCDTWEDAKGTGATGGIDAAQRVDILRRLGWASQCAAGQPLTQLAARTVLAAAPGIGAARAATVLDDLARRNLLLHAQRDMAGGLRLQRLQFSHAQFREYLAGAHIAEQWTVDAAAAEAELSPHWFDGQWSEVLAFALDSVAAEPQLRDGLLASALRAADPYADLLHRAALLTARLLARVGEADAALVVAVVPELESLATHEPALRELAVERLLGLSAHAPAWPALVRFARGQGAGVAWADDEAAGDWARLQALRGRLRAVEALSVGSGATASLALLAGQPVSGIEAELTVAELRSQLGDKQAAQQAWRSLFESSDGGARRTVAASMARAGEATLLANWLDERLANLPATVDDLLLAGELQLPLDLDAHWQSLLVQAQLELAALPEEEGFAPEGLSKLIYGLMSPAGSRATALPAGKAVARAALRHPALAWFAGTQIATVWPDLRAEVTRALGEYVRRSIVEPEQVRADFSRQNIAVSAIAEEPDDAVAVPVLLRLLELASASGGRSYWHRTAAASLGRRGRIEEGMSKLLPQVQLPAAVDDAHPDKGARGREASWWAMQELAPARLQGELDALYRNGEPEADAHRLVDVWRVSGVSVVASDWFEALAQQPDGRRFLQELAALDHDGEASELARRALIGEPDEAPEPSRSWDAAEAEAAFRSAFEKGWHVGERDQETTSTEGDMFGLLDEIDPAAAPDLIDRWVAHVAQAESAADRLSNVLSGLSARGWTSPAWAETTAALARRSSVDERVGLLKWLLDHA